MQSKLSLLSNAQVIRLWYRIHERIQDVFGSNPYGVDYPTLYLTSRGLAKAYMLIKAEGIRRGI